MQDLKEKPHVIIIALNSGYDLHAETRMIKEYSGLDSKPLTGSYKGQCEYSHAVVLNKPLIDEKVLLDLARDWKQESVLLLDKDRRAELIFLDKNVQRLPVGRFTAVYDLEALKHDSWTYDPMYNQYYICK